MFSFDGAKVQQKNETRKFLGLANCTLLKSMSKTGFSVQEKALFAKFYIHIRASEVLRKRKCLFACEPAFVGLVPAEFSFNSPAVESGIPLLVRERGMLIRLDSDTN